MKKLVVLGVLAMFVLATVAMAAVKVPSAFAKKPAVGTEAMDLVSGKTFKTTAETPFVEHMKKFYGFEDKTNADLFKAEPAKYMPKVEKKAEKKAEPTKKEEAKPAPAPAPAPK